MSKILAAVHYNSACLKCGAREHEMTRIGPMVFCNQCYLEEFGENYEIDNSSEIYKKWIKSYKEIY